MRGRAGFTLIELLVVIIVIGILIGLLLPVIAGALRDGQERGRPGRDQSACAGAGELQVHLRRLSAQPGPLWRAGLLSGRDHNIARQQSTPTTSRSANLAQRSLTALRKFFPKVVFSTHRVTAAAERRQQLLVRLQRQRRDGQRRTSCRGTNAWCSSWGHSATWIRRPARLA